MSKNELTIDGIEYIKKDSIKSQVINTDSLVYTLVRTYSAGVWAGYPTGKVENGEVTLCDARNIFEWYGAAGQAQIATEGFIDPSKCKMTVPVTVTLYNVIQTIEITELAKKSIDKVAVWKK